MRMLVPLAFLVLATPAAAVSLPMANGYGALDAPRDTDPLTLGQLFCDGSSRQIVDLLLNEMKQANVDLRLRTSVAQVEKNATKQ